MQSHFMKDTSESFLFTLRANYFFASDAITNRFAGNYFLGKFLDNNLKDDVSKNLSSQNLFAGEANWEASLTFHPDTNDRKAEAFIAFRSHQHSDARFSRDLFELFFRGNKTFAGKTADLGDFFFQSYSYRQFVFGIGNAFTLSKSERLYIGADIAINQGIKFLKVEGRSSSLYTDPDGEYIDADLHATILTDDSAAQHPSKLDGTGYSGDIYLEYETENSALAFSAENFGSIHWNKWSTQVSLDSTFRFEGVDVRDLFEIGDSIKVIDGALDSVFYKNYISNRSEQRVITQLPMKISGSYTVFFHEKKLAATLGIDALLHTYSTMRYYLGVNCWLNRSNRIGLLAASGGYTNFHGGLSYLHVFPWHLQLEAACNYLYPILSAENGKSQGAYLSLSKSF
jgi:hypothetical protein